MKSLFKKLFVFGAVLLSVAITTNLNSPIPTYASCRNFAGLTSWDCNVVEIDGGSGGSQAKQDQLVNNIWIIASNVFADISVIAAYLVLGFVIYGGYLYIFSNGDVGKVANGKKTLTHAFIGLAIVMLSNVILNAIRVALVGNNAALSDCVSSECISASGLITNTVQWFIGIGGVVAAIFVVIGGIGYTTSAGDPGKLQKAKTTILYALIGLAIVGLAEVITAFVTNAIRNAENTSLINNITIAKEITHEK